MQEDLIDKPAQKDMEFLIDLIVSVRNIRSQMLVPLDKKVNIIVSTANKNDVKLIEENQQYIKTLAKVDNVKTQNFTCGPKRPKQSAMAVAGSAEVYVLLAGVIDIDAEKARLSKKISEMENILKGLSDRLKNKDFLKKAPEEVVEKEKEKEKQLSENIEKLKTSLKSLA
jgi:valyl-tRNA synthetase